MSSSTTKPSTTLAPTVLPQITLQDDFSSVLSDIRANVVPLEDFWLSCYVAGRPSVHGKVRASLGRGGSVDLEGREGVEMEYKDEHTFLASCPALDVRPTEVSLPRHTLKSLRGDQKDDGTVNTQPSVLAVAMDAASLAIGYADGRVRCIPLSQSVRATLGSSLPDSGFGDGLKDALTFTSHLSGTAVTTLAYLPTGQRMLSGGVDGMLHVLNTSQQSSMASIPPICTLKGHFRPVASAVPLGTGRIVSVSRDRSLRLWDIDATTQVRMESLGSGANSVALSPELESEGVATAYVALDSGKVAVADLRAPGTAVTSFDASNCSLTSVSLSSSLLATGDSRGVVRVFDVRSANKSTPLYAFTRGSADINSLEWCAPQALAVCAADWLPYVAELPDTTAGEQARLRTELAGAGGGDCAPVRALCAGAGAVWSAGEDGAVRAYVV